MRIAQTGLFLAVLGLLCLARPAPAAVAAADQSSGYAGLVLDKVSRHWQPPADSTPRTAHIRVRIDSGGRVVSCAPTAPSGNPALDASLCAAVKAAGGFAEPPYSMPIDVFLHFWTGQPGQASERAPVQTPGSPTAEPRSQSAPSALAPAHGAADAPERAAPSKEVSKQTPSGDAAAAENAYVAKVMERIRPHIALPKDVRGGKSCTVRVLVDAKGRIVRSALSGKTKPNSFDKAVLKAVGKTGKVDPPPGGSERELALTFVLEGA